MRQIHDQQYARFAPNERLNLTLAALARGDATEADRLWQTCPRYQYHAHDFAYTLRLNAVMLLNSLLFEKCVFHYNRIKKIEGFILEAEYDLAFAEEKNSKEMANETQKLIEHTQKALNTHLSRLKGLFTGFKLFCAEAYLDYENLINITSIKNCCHDLDFLLESEVETDMQYVDQVKVFFWGYWNF
jgi:hypothetical protein